MKTTFWTAAALAMILLVAAVPGSDADLMQQKSAHAERIFRYLALGDLAKVEVEASVLGKLTRKAGFTDHDESYQAYGENFLKTVDALREEAGNGNMAGSYYQFSRMAGMCFSCHEHVRDGEN